MLDTRFFFFLFLILFHLNKRKQANRCRRVMVTIPEWSRLDLHLYWPNKSSDAVHDDDIGGGDDDRRFNRRKVTRFSCKEQALKCPRERRTEKPAWKKNAGMRRQMKTVSVKLTVKTVTGLDCHRKPVLTDFSLCLTQPIPDNLPKPIIWTKSWSKAKGIGNVASVNARSAELTHRAWVHFCAYTLL